MDGRTSLDCSRTLGVGANGIVTPCIRNDCSGAPCEAWRDANPCTWPGAQSDQGAEYPPLHFHPRLQPGQMSCKALRGAAAALPTTPPCRLRYGVLCRDR